MKTFLITAERYDQGDFRIYPDLKIYRKVDTKEKARRSAVWYGRKHRESYRAMRIQEVS